MWEEGINTKPQIYYNNNNAGTPQASKRKEKKVQHLSIDGGLMIAADLFIPVFVRSPWHKVDLCWFH